MSTIAIHHGPHPRGLGVRFAFVISLLAIGGCYEGAPGVEDELELEEEGGGDLDVEPIDGPLPTSTITCEPTMHLFPVADAHNIGYDDGSCGTGTCEISCPDVHANSDWGGDHHGIDIFAYHRAPLVAVTSGTIQKVGVAVKADGSLSTTSGIRVRLRDDCGWEYYYGHLDEAVVYEGQRVEAGELLGYMGKTGTASVHLHFNVSPNGGYSNDIDPIHLLRATSATACGGDAAPPPPPSTPEPEPQPEGCDTSTLWPDQALFEGQAISSCNGRYSLVMQGDGNVVLYETGTSKALWHTQTHGTAGHAVVMQGDGNFVLYDTEGKALWHTQTHGHPGAALRVEEDGNVIVWNGWSPIWKAR